MKKRILSFLLAAIMVFSLLPVAVLAGEGTTAEETDPAVAAVLARIEALPDPADFPNMTKGELQAVLDEAEAIFTLYDALAEEQQKQIDLSPVRAMYEAENYLGSAPVENPAVHTHEFTYSASGDTLTATCTAGCAAGYDTTPLSLTLTADGFDEAALKAWTDAVATAPTVKYTDSTGAQNLGTTKPTALGSYKVQATVGSATAELAFEIKAHTHDMGTEATTDDITFEKAIKTFANLQDLFTNGGSGYLANNIDCTAALTVAADKTVNLCLNDKVLNFGMNGNITVASGTTLNLYDCGEGTTRYYDKDGTTGLWTLNTALTSGDYTTTGGVITGGTASSNGGGVNVSGTFTMHGGTLVGNKSANNGGGVCGSAKGFKIELTDAGIIGNTASEGGGVAGGNWNFSGTVTIQNSEISNNTASNDGGGAYLYSCTSTLTDCTISNNTAKTKHGGGIYSYNVKLIGCTITDNKALSTDSLGGGVYVYATTTVLNGSIISGNTAGKGGGVYSEGELVLGGKTVIRENYNQSLVLNNWQMPNSTSYLMTIGNGSNGAPALEKGASIGVTRPGPSVSQFTNNGTKDDVKYFTPDPNSNRYFIQWYQNGWLEITNSSAKKTVFVTQPKFGGVIYASEPAVSTGYTITLTLCPDNGYELESLSIGGANVSPLPTKNNDNSYTYPLVMNADTTVTAEFVVAPHTHGEGDEAIPFQPWTDNDSLPGKDDLPEPEKKGSYYLTKDVTLSEPWGVPTNATVDLCLNGYVIKLKDGGSGCAISVGSGATLNLYDCAPNAKHVGTSLPDGGVITGGKGTIIGDENCGGGVYVSGTFNMYGGTITGNAANNGGGVYVDESTTFVMTGGTITGNTATGNGGGVYVNDGATFVMTGGSITGNTADAEGNGGGVYVSDGSEACLAAGTMITMADGSQKPVEALQEGDEIRTFDHETGTVSQAKINFFWHYDQPRTGAFTLHFSNDIDVTAVGGHSFYERAANKYITIDTNNAEAYIGHSFYNLEAKRWETLESVTFINEPVETYIVATEKHLNCVAEGMLTCEDDIYTALIDAFEFDESMKVDAEKKAEDIARWGIWNWDQSLGCPKNEFDALDLQYALIAEGKGLITLAYIKELFDICAPLYEQDAAAEESPMLLGAVRQCVDEAGETYFEASATSVQTGDPSGVTLGGTAKITGNTKSGGATNNLYLASGKIITLGDGSDGKPVPTTDFSVGVTTATPPTTATTVAISDASDTDSHAYFFADKAMQEDVVAVGDGTPKKYTLYLAVPQIVVEQTGENPTYGTAMSADEDFFTVEWKNFGTDPTTLELEWKHVDGDTETWDENAPTGITASLANKKISIETTATLNAGDYVFRVTNGKAEKINDPNDTEEPYDQINNPEFVCGTGTLTVLAKEVGLTWTAPTNLEYSKTEKVPTVAVKNGDLCGTDTCTVTAALTAGADNVNVTDDGFTFTASTLSNTNYKLPENKVSDTYKITPKEVGLEWFTLTAEQLVYNKSAKTLTATATGVETDDTCNVTVALTTGNDNINVGKFTYTATALSNSNYKLPATVTSSEYTITPKEATLLWTAPASLVYSSSAKVPTASVSNLESDDTCNVTVALTTGNDNINVGKFTFTATALSNNNYKLPETVTSSEYTITVFSLANATVTVDPTAYNYTGSEIKPTPAVTFDGTNAIPTADYTVSYENNTNAAASTDTNAPTVTVEPADSNTNVTGSKSVKFTITKAQTLPEGTPTNYDVNALTSSSLSLETIGITFDGAKITNVAAVSDKTGKVISSAPAKAGDGKTISWVTLDPPSGTEFDQYKLTISTDNYEDFTVTVSFRGKVPVTFSGLTAANATYDGQPKTGVSGTAVCSANSTNVTAACGRLVYTYYKDSVGNANKLLGAPKDAGSYVVVISIPDDNTAYTGSASYNFTVAPKKITVKPNDKTAVVRDAIPELGADDFTVTGLVSGDTLTTKPTLVYEPTPDMSKTGTAAITASGADAGDNYIITYEPGTLTINARDIPASPSFYAVAVNESVHGSVSADKMSATSLNTVTVTVTPDEGFTLENLTVLDKNGKEVEIKDLGNGKYSFKMPSSKVTVNATFMEENTMLNFFMDVKAADYYYDAVLWAAKNDITKGTDAVHFSPNAPVTRAQAVTFLWRAAGCPEPTGNASKFTDVVIGSYYEKAVAWAIEQGITKGTGSTTFSPDLVCTRGQIATFLARFAGVKDDDPGYTHSFTDVMATDYCNNAVAWAKDNKVTEGTSATTFSPNADCTRAQVVTFLYRWMVR